VRTVWRRSGRWTAAASLLLIIVVALSDVLLGDVSAFWSRHNMLTNLISSLAFALLTITVIDYLLERGRAARRQVVTLVAYNAIARAPIGQRRVMWQLVCGGEYVITDVDFPLSDQTRERLGRLLRQAGLDPVDEDAVINDESPTPDQTARISVLADNREWLALAYTVLSGCLHTVRLVIARWSPLLIASDESVSLLAELGRQAEELSNLYVQLLPFVRGRKNAFTDEEKTSFVRRWTRAFANAIALDEALIRRGGERGPGWINPARHLLPAIDVADLDRRDQTRDGPLRVYP